MDIVEYDQVDPTSVVALNYSALGLIFPPARVNLMRLHDKRIFPCFGLYAHEDHKAIGQVLLFRIPVITTDGFDEVGGLAASCTHPAHTRKGVITVLVEESHKRFQAEGLEYSTLGTNRRFAAYNLFKNMGYKDIYQPTSIFLHADEIIVREGLNAKHADQSQLAIIDQVFQKVATNKLGFSRRFPGFITMLVEINRLASSEVWLIWRNDFPVGYALAKRTLFGPMQTYQLNSILSVYSLVLINPADAPNAIHALIRDSNANYIKLIIDDPLIAMELVSAGYPTPSIDWHSLMIKPLDKNASVDKAKQLLGVGTDQFMISLIDTT